jgi:uncharacterized protein YyaL (SSP411 family)
LTNRLATSTSPYLLQHAENPVDWWPWTPEAFAEAIRREVPILLSVGYAACHWCHVMAHECFEDAEVAAVLNGQFVCIKVDREERPDIDAIYMSATTAMTGHGGWPMTCFLTPSGAPFFCGTYFPKPNFLQLLAGVTEAWTQRRDEVLAAGERIINALQSVTAGFASTGLGAAELDAAASKLGTSYDEARGGFGGAPKFPPSMTLEFLLRHHARTGDERSLVMVAGTCEAMARGGMYDQLAGGFARYSVDADWVVPHFEKMLYDNALLLRVYLHWWRATGSALARRVVLETADFLIRDLGTSEGCFASALDADTDGVEGLTYAWNPDQLREILDADDGAKAAQLLAVTDRGSFEHGLSTLQLRRDPSDPDWWLTIRQRLLRARNDRPQPGRDDKVVTAWNGLAIAALAEAGALLNRPEYLTAAVRCATFLLEQHVVDGRLRRSSRDGLVGAAAGVAEDYGDLIEGLLVLHQATGQLHWLTKSGELLDVVLKHFPDGDGGFFDTADDAEQLFTRPADPSDNATPSGQAALAGALLTYSALTGSTVHRAAADAAINAAGELVIREPRFAGWTAAIAEAALAGPLQVAIVGTDADELVATARASCSPGLVLVHGEPDSAPLLAGRPLVNGVPSAYVCRGFVCDRPVSSVPDLQRALS